MKSSSFKIETPKRTSLFPGFLAILALSASSAYSLPAETAAQAPSPLAPVTSLNTIVPKAEPEPNLPSEELGDLRMIRKQYQAALEAYLRVSPRTATVWNKIGIVQQQMFINVEAQKSYRSALRLEPHNPDVMNNLGSVYYSIKEYGQAERLYRKALKINPKSALIYKNLGTNLLAENKFKKGWDCYQTALSIDPEIFERVNQLRIGEPTPTQKRGAMNFYLAKSYARVGMPDLAVGYLRMAIDEGFTDRKHVLADKEFASLRGLSSFERLISEQQLHQ